ncbi:hypothetical protein TNCV_112611 [Trichonephila clavipes]|nr:hypothetical protein TNCV_112611 [Trichonephila clavipes]
MSTHVKRGPKDLQCSPLLLSTHTANDVGGAEYHQEPISICRTLCEWGHLLAHSMSNVLSCCKPPTTYWFRNLGNEIKVTG